MSNLHKKSSRTQKASTLQHKNQEKQFFNNLIAIQKPNKKDRSIHNRSNTLLSVYQSPQAVNNPLKSESVLNQWDQKEFIFQQIQYDFQKEFLFGCTLTILRKGKLKEISVYLDPNLLNMLWFSSLTKTFLFDLSFTSIDLCDYQVQKTISSQYYFILRYFQEQIPLIFKNQKEKEKYLNLFKYYILFNKERQYPPFFSKIMKLYLIQQIKEDQMQRKTVKNILDMSQILKIKSKQENLSLLADIFQNQKRKKDKLSKNLPFTEQTQIKFELTLQYFRINHCLLNLKSVFQQYSGVKMFRQIQFLGKIMKKKHFIKFLMKEQQMTQEQAIKAAQNIDDQLNFYDFCVFLQNDKINAAALAEEIDEDLPLTDYFCFSSHNTYLSGNQLTSDCKIQRYLEDLQRGLKCVQLDIHNDGNVPVINHAFKDKSLCKAIDFQETIMEIAKYCNSMANHYPIILSFQNHAKEENRFKITNILYKYLKKNMFFISEEYTTQNPTIFKTLREMTGKVIIKTDSKFKEIEQFKKKTYLQKESKECLQIKAQITFPSKAFQERFNKFQQTITKSKKRKLQFDYSIPNSLFLPISEMTKLTGMFKSQNGVDNDQSFGYECTSINNSKIEKFKHKIVNYTMRSFLRIYPVSTQIMSNNYDPIPSLQIGAQIIALNTQTKDDQVFMLMSYFKAGRSQNPEKIGYIPKPSYLRASKYSPKPNLLKKIKIQVVTTYHQMKIVFFGTQRDMKLNEKPGVDNQFTVYDYDEGFLMFYIDQKFKQCIPIRFIRQGYRVLVAKNEYYKDSGLRVIIKISIDNHNIL